MKQDNGAGGGNPSDRVRIFDTTLRDGEQSPGFTMNGEEKLVMAKQLARLKVDVIEAGFPLSSPGDFEAVKNIAEQVEGPSIAALARAIRNDIDVAWQAIRNAKKPRIHTFIGTSEIHRTHQLKKSRQEVLEMAVDAVRHAKSYTGDVEFSAMDAVRTEMDYLCEVLEAVIEAGAVTVNIPDTVGYAIPSEFGEMIRQIRSRVPNIQKAVVSVHCHNDLGLAVANSLAAVQNGCRQIECTVNGIGERAGNASMEEVVMALKTRRDFLGPMTGIDTREILKTSKLLTSITGIAVQPNKAIVGKNAFAHQSGIHQDGFLKQRTTYEIMTPESIGLKQSSIILGKSSGRAAFVKKLGDLGLALSEENVNRAFGRFKQLADLKKEVYDEDLEAIVEDEIGRGPEEYLLEYIQTTSGSQTIPTATVRLNHNGRVHQDSSTGDGPVAAAYNAIDRITGLPGSLEDYAIRSVTGGEDAIGEVTVKVRFPEGDSVNGKGASTDVIEASAKAYLNAVNKYARRSGKSVTSPKP